MKKLKEQSNRQNQPVDNAVALSHLVSQSPQIVDQDSPMPRHDQLSKSTSKSISKSIQIPPWIEAMQMPRLDQAPARLWQSEVSFLDRSRLIFNHLEIAAV